MGGCGPRADLRGLCCTLSRSGLTRVTVWAHQAGLNGGKDHPMGRFGTAAIIALALAGAAVESHADDLANTAPARGPAVPVQQLLADSAPAPAPAAAPVPD